MIVVVVALGALVLWLAHRSTPDSARMPLQDVIDADTQRSRMSGGLLMPGMNDQGFGSTGLPPDTSLPSLGATGTFAPTLTGGSALIARDNRTRLGMRYINAQPVTSRQILAQMTPGSTTGVFGLTDASSGSFAREDSPQLTQQAAVFQPRPAGKLQLRKL